MDLINKDAFVKLCKTYKITKVNDNVLYCIENYLLEVIERETTRKILVEDGRDNVVKHETKRKRRKGGKFTSKKVQDRSSKDQVD